MISIDSIQFSEFFDPVIESRVIIGKYRLRSRVLIMAAVKATPEPNSDRDLILKIIQGRSDQHRKEVTAGTEPTPDEAKRMIVNCCKCFQPTRKWVCMKCGHRICASCKAKPRVKSERQIA